MEWKQVKNVRTAKLATNEPHPIVKDYCNRKREHQKKIYDAQQELEKVIREAERNFVK